MDKDYSVDDILSEIKQRKLREKGGMAVEQVEPPPRKSADADLPDAADTDDFPLKLEFTAPKEHNPPPTPAFQAETAVLPEETAAPETAPPDALRFDPVPEPGHKHNPLEFSGHVRSIADKAKMRPTKLNQHPQATAQPNAAPGPAIPEFHFQPVEPKEQNTDKPAGKALDFSSFRAANSEIDPPAAAAPTQAPFATGERTRVLPRFPTGKDIDPASLPRRIGRVDEDDPTYYEDDEYLRDDLTEGKAVDFSEYNSVKDRRDVATDIARVKLWLFVRTSITAVLTILLFYMTMAGAYVMPLPSALEPAAETMGGYLTACTVLTVLVALANSSAIGGGLISLFKMRANSDTLASLAVLAAIGQGIVGVMRKDIVDPTYMNLYFFVAALAMLLGCLGKMIMIHRIQSNFRVIASDKRKKALMTVESDEFCRSFCPEEIHKPTIAYAVTADFFTDFLGLSYSDKYDVGVNRAVAPVCIVGAVAVGVASYLLTSGDAMTVISAITAILCVSATFSATFIENIPLAKLAKKLAPQGGMVSGNKAVEDFCDTKALILTEKDLFSEGNVRLRGIRSYAQGRIDDAILDAASVICAADGALSPVFMQMLGGNRKLLKKVDNPVYENGMGISAWVEQRRVLIGNRQLMQNHGIQLPPENQRTNQVRSPEDGELIFLSNSGQVSAQFAVSYHIDEDLAAQLDYLAASDVKLIVYATDANITPHRIWELYGYPEELIIILPAERHAEYREMTRHRETAVAEIVYTGRASTLAGSITACVNARSSILSATIVQLLQIVLGYGLVAFMSFMGMIGSLNVVQLVIYQLFWFVAIFVVQKSKQP